MTLHRLTAGAGYRYLLRHIATGDCERRGPSPMTTYYAASGNPPGRWLGRGLGALGRRTGTAVAVGVEQGTVVAEEGMARLFSHGLDPSTGVPLGRRYSPAAPPADRVAAQVRALPGDLIAEARQRAVDAITRVELARESSPCIAGFDLTFTVMKSVSTLWAVADEKTQAAVYSAHRRAVGASLRFLEDRALFTRTGAAGCRQESTGGAVAAAFDHWDSRAGDPNLHTHLVVANKVQGRDGAWRSLDSRALHHAVVTISELYEALLVDELARSLPVRWSWRSRGPRRTPAFELDGVGDELMAAFSQRSTQIDAAMTTEVADFTARHGRAPNRIEIVRLRQQVARATRPAKKVRALGRLVERWRHRAATVTGESPEQLTSRVIGASLMRPVQRFEVAPAVLDVLAARVLDGVRERRSTWTRWNVMAEALRVTKPLIAASVADRLRIVDDVCDAALRRCVSLEAAPAFPSSGRYAREDGSSVFERPGEHTFTDIVILDAEHTLLAAAADTSAPTSRMMRADDALELASDQLAAVASISSSGRLVDALVGPAGSGKTTALAALRHVWERQHGHGSVIGLAPSASAAANLAGALGIACENTAKWRHETNGLGGEQRRAVIQRLIDERSAIGGDVRRLRLLDTALMSLTREARRWQIRDGQLVIVDEASLAGTLMLRELVDQVARARGKVLLVGDHQQLSAVDAGGAFGLIVDRTGGAHLRTLWRFAEGWEARATIRLRAGDVRVLDEYEDAGRLRAGPAESMLEEAYAAWSADVASGATTILLAPDAATVAALNTRAHNDRVQDGLVARDGVTTKSGTMICVGDRVVTRLNDRGLRAAHGHVRNGDLWDVKGVGADGHLVVVAARTALARRGVVGTAGSDEARSVTLPPAYVTDSVDLAYATTTHRAQGVTVDLAHVLVHPGMTRENLYVAMTRGRRSNRLYVSVDPVNPECDELPDPHAAGDAHEILEGILATSGAELSATATIARRESESTSVRRLEPIIRTIYADAARARWTERLHACGLSEGTVRHIAASPEGGGIFIALDRIAALTSRPTDVVRGLVKGIQGADASTRLLARARAWIERVVEEQDATPAPRSRAGLDADGIEILDRVEGLMAEHDAVRRTADEVNDESWLGLCADAAEPGMPDNDWSFTLEHHVNAAPPAEVVRRAAVAGSNVMGR
ncbi:relaxase domain-containing protein [Cellulomonas fimi]|uniref:MobF family relaxase n=1 Tax=Cellulomonas fimi TaxID=1708 RepID=UPI00234CA79E|nr:MobF family relaxase [Cellulomonas fimi]MDC7120589.1 relaxase domain-containing protein [Cellulomonas fimi]